MATHHTVRPLLIAFLMMLGVTQFAPTASAQTAPSVTTASQDANPTRLFFGPTGRSLKQGESYFGVFEVFMPFVQVGVTDRLSLGGGTPLVFGAGEPPIWFTPKFRVFSTARTDVSVGTLHFWNVGEHNAGIAYGVATHGTADSAVTAGLGYTYSGTDVGSAVVMIGGERRATRSVKLITENYIGRGGHGVLMGGVRFMGERLSADVGLFSPITSAGFFAGPMVNFVWKMK